MKKPFPVWGILMIVLAVFAIGFGAMCIVPYNKMVKLDEEVSTAQANIQAQLQARLDKINELVPLVQDVLDRQSALDADLAQLESDTGISRSSSGSFSLSKDATLSQLERADAASSQFVKDFNAALNNEPSLKSSQAVQDFMVTMEGQENRISYAREIYNEDVQSFNSYIRSFPHNLVAGMFGFEPKEKFQASEAALSGVDVSFD